MTHHEKILKILLILATISILAISGCSATQAQVTGEVNYDSVIERWIEALNSGNTDQFEQLHTEAAAYNSHVLINPVTGRKNLWDSIRRSNPNQIEAVTLFGQDATMCLQVSAVETENSFLYVFEFEQDLISHIYSYTSEYDLSKVPVEEAMERTADAAELGERIAIVDSQVNFLNKREFSGFIDTFAAEPVLYVPSSPDPVVGIDGIKNDVQGFVQYYPNVELKVYRTIGQGNFICQQIAVSNGPMNSLGFVHVFDGLKESQTYEFLSLAEIGN